MKHKGSDDEQEATQRSQITFPRTVGFEVAPEVWETENHTQTKFDKHSDPSQHAVRLILNCEVLFWMNLKEN